MKLVEILAAEMEEWPEGVTHLTQSEVDREIYDALNGETSDSVRSLNPRFDTLKSHSEKSYPMVTRAKWQAERDRQKGGEWKRHRGGKCPVPVGTKVSTRHRDGEVIDVHFHTATTGSGPTTMNAIWKHTGDGHDIMAYKIISQPQAEGVEVLPNEKTSQVMDATDRDEGLIRFENKDHMFATLGIEAKTDQIDGPLRWRDEVTELNAYIEKYTRERDALIERLASEGFALIPPVVSVVSGFSGVDMSDWNNWQVGDVIKVISNTGGHEFAIGTEVTVITVDTFDRSYRIEATAGGNDWWLAKDDGEFIRRP